VLIYVLGWWRGRPAAGMVAALVLATAVHFTWLARVGRIDMPLTLAVSLALGAYYLGQRRRQDRPGRGAWSWFLVAYLAVAVAVLLKGPIGMVLPGMVAGVHLLLTGELVRKRQPGVGLGRHWLRLIHEFGAWWGIPLVAALTVPWFWWANERTGGQFFRVFFWYHNVERGLGGSGKLAEHPWWFYGPRLAFDFLPWSPALAAGLWFWWRRPALRQDAEVCFGLVWLGTVVVVLSFMKFKRSDYLLPAYPGAALFLGGVAERWFLGWRARGAGQPRRLIGLARAALIPLAMALVVAGWWFYLDRVVPSQEADHGYRTFAAAIRRKVPAPQPVILFRTKPHALTFHLGRPVDTLLEWENLDWWAGRAGCYYIVLPPAQAAAWPRHLRSGGLEEVFRSTDLPGNRGERTLILMRTLPPTPPLHP
jgi:4-amino-4-deoxy-L-arabinose transferase-like glycosyltransferase